MFTMAKYVMMIIVNPLPKGREGVPRYGKVKCDFHRFLNLPHYPDQSLQIATIHFVDSSIIKAR